jgi:soluble lytic murein transglycosylase
LRSTLASAWATHGIVRKVWLLAAIGVLLLAAVGWYGWRQGRLEHSQDTFILAAAARYEIDPDLVRAVIWRESRFDPGARGKSGELGLMQLQELSAQEWADAERLAHFEHEHCLDPRTNTLAGTFYLRKLLRRYQGTDNPLPYALADYNAGRGNVIKWNTGPAATNSEAFLQQIGFPGTSNYVLAVMQRYEHYRAARK